MKKKIFATLSAVLLFAALAGQVSATSYFSKISKYTSGNTYTTVTDPEYKANSTDTVVALYNSGFASTYRVTVKGCTYDGTDANNCTYYANKSVSYVVCNRGTTYSIDTVVHERAYSHAVLSVCPLGGPGTTTGEWAPDSTQTFATPEGAG